MADLSLIGFSNTIGYFSKSAYIDPMVALYQTNNIGGLEKITYTVTEGNRQQIGHISFFIYDFPLYLARFHGLRQWFKYRTHIARIYQGN